MSGTLQLIGEEIWIAEGAPVSFLGFPYPTRMTVVRLANGDLWVCSPTECSDALDADLSAQGPVRHLVSPNKIHHLFLADWAKRWPQARLYASPGLRPRRPDLRFDADLGDEPEGAWHEAIDQVVFHGSLFMEEVVFFHRRSRTAIFTDLIQRFDPHHMRGWRSWIMRLDGLVGPNGSTPREWRLSFWNRRAARRALHKALAWNPDRLVIAHGDWAPENARQVIENSLRWLA